MKDNQAVVQVQQWRQQRCHKWWYQYTNLQKDQIRCRHDIYERTNAETNDQSTVNRSVNRSTVNVENERKMKERIRYADQADK